jgi:hypothetical protein
MNATTRTIEVARKGERQKFKPKAWSHQDELKEAVGKTVRMAFLDDSSATGVLVSADAFTLRVRDEQSVFTYFKHSMIGYEVME